MNYRLVLNSDSFDRKPDISDWLKYLFLNYIIIIIIIIVVVVIVFLLLESFSH